MLSFKVLFSLSFVFKCILFFILHVIVINYVYRKVWLSYFSSIKNYHLCYLYTILPLIWQEIFIKKCDAVRAEMEQGYAVIVPLGLGSVHFKCERAC